MFKLNEKIIKKHVASVSYDREKASYLNDEVLVNSKYNAKSEGRNIPKKILKLEFQYGFNYYRGSYVTLSLKENNSYEITNMSGFLNAFKYKNYAVYCSGFTFNPKIYDFNSEDIKILDLLIEAYDSPENSYKLDENSYSDKIVYLTDNQAKKLLSFINENKREFKAVINDKTYHNVKINKENLPIEFSVELDGNNIILNHKGQLPIAIMEDKEYFFYSNNIYLPPQNQIHEYMYFYTKFIENNKATLSFNENLDIGFDELICKLRKITKSIDIVTEKERIMFKNSLKTKLYFYKDNDTVTMKIIFNYKDINIDPFNDSKYELAAKVSNRDIRKEAMIFEKIKGLGFELTRIQFVLKDSEKILYLLTEGINELRELAEVYYDESFKDIKIHTPEDYRASLSLDNNNLLQFNFDISGVRKSEIKNIIAALKENQKYYKLTSGGYVSLREKELKKIANLINYLDIEDRQLDSDTINVSKYKALYIDQVLKESPLVYVNRNQKFKELVDNIQNVSKVEIEVPAALENIMRKYQRVGFKWFKTLTSYGFGGILADEMGLGKTLQAISVMVSYVEECSKDESYNKKPVIVITPTSLVYNWLSEIEKFAPHLKTLVMYGNQNERQILREDIEEVDVIITSYSVLKNDIYHYVDLEFSYCFIDEAQQIKNHNSKNAKTVKLLKAKGYFALTGTPIENSLKELWSIFDFIMPGYLMSYNRFMKKYEIPIIQNKDEEALEALNKQIQPFILRRLKSQVMRELPPKIEKQLVIEMTDEQKATYISYLSLVRNRVNHQIITQGINRSRVHIFGELTHLRQICCDPSILLSDFQGESAKMLALDEIIEECLSSGHRILLFSQFTSVLAKIAVRLSKNKIDYFYLDGKTKSMDRLDLANRFNEGEADIFLISLKAGGTGLNLTGADVVIHFDPWWNPAVEDQATDRAHRIGQTKTVEVIKFITKGTIEEKIYNLQEKKKDIIKNVLHDCNNDNAVISSMTQEEIEELFLFTNQ